MLNTGDRKFLWQFQQSGTDEISAKTLTEEACGAKVVIYASLSIVDLYAHQVSTGRTHGLAQQSTSKLKFPELPPSGVNPAYLTFT